MKFKKPSLESFTSFEKWGGYVFSALIFAFFFLIYNQTNIWAEGNFNNILSEMLIVGGMVASMGVCLVLHYRGKLKVKDMITVVFILSVAVKLAYVIQTPYNVRQHDVEGIGSSGHLQYIYNLGYDNMLPDTNTWQFSHPPFHHFLAGLVVKIGDLFGFSMERCFESVQYLTAFYMSVATLWFYKILRELGIRGRALLFSFMLFALHPTLTIFSGSINNDPLLFMLSVGVIYYLIKWYKAPSLKLTAVLGLLCGLTMMTKFSGALMVAVVGIAVLVKAIKENKIRLLLQAPLFLVICLPLGFWYQIRNMSLFDQPLGYVAPIDISSQLYTGDTSVLSRIILPPIKEIFSAFADPWEHVNIIIYTLKCSVFGEYQWPSAGVAVVLLLLNTAFIGFTLFTIIKLFKSKADFGSKLILSLSFFVQLGFFLYFYLSSPFGCTMDFRYIPVTLIGGISSVALYINAKQKTASSSSADHLTVSLFNALSVCFAVASLILFV